MQQQRSLPRLERLRVRVIFPTADGVGERDLTERLLGLGGGNTLPLLCTSHRLDFAAISRATDVQQPTDYFFSDMAIKVPKLPRPDFAAAAAAGEEKEKDPAERRKALEAEYSQSAMVYNFFNMLALLLPGVSIGLGRNAQFVSLKDAAPPERAGRVPPRAARLYSSAPAANTATPGAARGGGGAPLWIALRRRHLSLRRARILASSSSLPPPPPPRGGAPATDDTMTTGGTYTVFRSTWLNDAINHPVYAALIRAILEYQRWRDNEDDQNIDSLPARTRFLNELTMTHGVKETNTAQQKTFPTAIGAIAPTTEPENPATVDLRKALKLLQKRFDLVMEFARADAKGMQFDLGARQRAITAFMDQMADVRVRQRTVEGTRSSGSTDPLASARQALSGLAPLFAAYQAVEMEELANNAIASMDVQYDSAAPPPESGGDKRAPPRLTAKYMEDMHPQFVQIAGALRTFHKTYVASNRHWRDLVRTIVTDKPRAKSAFLVLMYACREMTEGRVIAAEERKEEALKYVGAVPSGKDLLPVVGLDLVLSSSSKAAGAANAAPPSGGASALSPLREAYVQCDVAGFAFAKSDLGSAACAFRDFNLGVNVRRAFFDPRPTQWVGQIPAPLFMPPPPEMEETDTAAAAAKKVRVG